MTIHIGLPQGILLALVAAGLIASTVEHGKPRNLTNAYITFVSALIELALLAWGGFFR